MLARFGIDSSSHFSFIVWTNTQTDIQSQMQVITLPTHHLPLAWVKTCLTARITLMSWYQRNKYLFSPYHCEYYSTFFINFNHLLQSTASSFIRCQLQQSNHNPKLGEICFGLSLSQHQVPQNSYLMQMSCSKEWQEALQMQRDRMMCFVTRNNKSDFQTYSRSLTFMPFNRPCMISY